MATPKRRGINTVAHPRPTGRSPTRRAHITRHGLKHGARLNTPGGAAVLGARYGASKQYFLDP